MATTVNDDEEKLVREVIEENPVEDVGVRAEWVQKVGWNRKEDVFGSSRAGGLRGRGGGASPIIIVNKQQRKDEEHDDQADSRDHALVVGGDRVVRFDTGPPRHRGETSSSTQTQTTAIPTGALSLVGIFLSVVALSRIIGLGNKKKNRSS